MPFAFNIQNMKRIFLSFVILLVSVLFVQAQLLWKITGNGLKKNSFLFGTNYLIPMAYLDSVENLHKAFGDCEVVVSEVVATNVDAGSLLRKTAFIQGDKSLKDFIPKDKQTTVDSILKSELKIGLKELSKMQPEYVLKMFKIELFRNISGIIDDVQTDAYFQAAANQKGIKVTGLESIQELLNHETDPNQLQKQCDKLTKALLNKDSLNKELIQLSYLYKKQKINDLALFLRLGDSKNTSSDEVSILNNQNEVRIKKITELMKMNSCFITVGVELLAGETGLIEGLRSKGFKVKAVQ